MCYTAWEAFAKLNQRRTSNGFGVNPIGYEAIAAYCNLYSVVLEPWEIDLICAFDNEVLIAHSKQVEKSKAQNSTRTRKK